MDPPHIFAAFSVSPQLGKSPSPIYGPTEWQTAPKSIMDDTNDRHMVAVIRTANFDRITKAHPKRKDPHPAVVIMPAMMLMPISR